ncbi:Crp/Fnr family transcriptional regulator [Chryseobacterium sp. SIMBA_038]|uniref:Crp/Fnr family transcriptional regulator n=1 Tax=Chryseobacterium sp. SIMBA_038 TaxID=3085780 RepID=UPI00397E6A49
MKNHIALTPDEAELLKNKVVKRKIKRRQFLLQEGMVCHYYSFIMEGCFKMYGIDSKGIEYNIEFAVENDWIVDIDSFNSTAPSVLFIEAVVPSTVLQISKEDLTTLFAICPKFERIFRMIIEDKFVLLQKRILYSISYTATERYLLFLQQYPALAQKLPSSQIASYLGITPEFLSKIRRNIVNK